MRRLLILCLYSILLQYIVTFSKCSSIYNVITAYPYPIQLPANKIQQYQAYPTPQIQHRPELDCEIPRKMAEIPSHFFEDCVNYWLDHGPIHRLYMWFLDGKNITRIAEDAFDKSILTSLHLSNNQIVNLHKNTFKPLKELKYLDLSHNHIEAIDSDLFYYNRKIEYLTLKNNNIKIIGDGAFRMNPVLSTILISNNPGLNRIDLTNIFRGNGMHLEHSITSYMIDLGNCGLDEIFIPMDVEKLNVQNNQITSINAHPKNLLKFLDLKNNNLASITHLKLPFLDDLIIYGNSVELSDVYGFKKLTSLHIDLDPMQNISAGEIRKNLPLLHRASLRSPFMKTTQATQIRNDCKQYDIDCCVMGEDYFRNTIFGFFNPNEVEPYLKLIINGLKNKTTTEYDQRNFLRALPLVDQFYGETD